MGRGAWKKVAFLGGVLTLSIWWWAEPLQAQQKTIRMGSTTGANLVWVIRDKQLLEKRGYKVEWHVFQYGAPLQEAMAAGSVDVAFGGTLPMVMMGVANPEVWYFLDEAANVAGMVVAKDSTIRTAADLKGKKVAFPGKGSQQYGLLMSYLSRAGLKETDLELVRANAPDMLTLLRNRNVEGFVAWVPFISEAVRTGVARTLWMADDLHKVKGGHWVGQGYSVRAPFARESRAAVVDVVRAMHETVQLLRTHPDEVAQILSKASGLPPEAIHFLIKNKFAIYFDPKEMVPSRDALKQMLQILTEHKVVRIDRNLDDVLANLVHPEFAEEAVAAR